MVNITACTAMALNDRAAKSCNCVFKDPPLTTIPPMPNIKDADEARLHELMKALADIMCVFAPGAKIKEAKKNCSRAAAIIKAIDRLKVPDKKEVTS